MVEFQQRALPPIAHHKGTMNWSQLTKEQQDELITKFFDDTDAYNDLVMELDWKSEQHVGFIQTFGLIENILREAGVLYESQPDETISGVPAQDRLILIETLMNTCFGRRLAQVYYPTHAGQNYDLIDEELERVAECFIDLLLECDSLKWTKMFGVAIDRVLSNLEPVGRTDIVEFPPGQIAHFWHDEEGEPEDNLNLQARMATDELEQESSRGDFVAGNHRSHTYKLERTLRFPDEMVVDYSEMRAAVQSKAAILWADNALSIKAARAGFPVNPFATLLSILMPILLFAALPVGWFFGFWFGALCVFLAVMAFRISRKFVNSSILKKAYADEGDYNTLNEIGAVWVRKL